MAYPSSTPPTCFANAMLDRAAIHRPDAAALDTLWQDPLSQALSLHNDALLMTSHNRLFWRKTRDLSRSENSIFLGKTDKGIAIFAVEISDPDKAPPGQLIHIRKAASYLSSLEAHAAATARTLFHWHQQNPYCAKCGHLNQRIDAGWKRSCPQCQTDVFPRINPVAIMLAVHGESCLLARRPIWPQGHYSCLAGFIEAGESIEDGAAREMAEEAGVQWSGKARYLFSQPWPFPACLMVGLEMEVTDTAITLDHEELAEACWFDRPQMRKILSGQDPNRSVPGPEAVAHHIIRQWAFDRDEPSAKPPANSDRP